MFNLSRQEKIIFFIIVSILVITFGWKFYGRGKNEITIIPSTTEGETISLPAEDGVDKSICIIHITGAVNQPGVYQLDQGKRVIDAVKIAGGEAEGANLDAVNLAAHIYDGQKIVIPFIFEINNDTLYSSLETVATPQRQMNFDSSSLLNLNSAESSQLENLPGIGPVLADRILEYRRDHGMFHTMEEIMNVPGIGEKKFESIKELITVY